MNTNEEKEQRWDASNNPLSFVIEHGCKNINRHTEGDSEEVFAVPASVLWKLWNSQAALRAESEPVGYVHLVPDEFSQEYDVRFWKNLPIGTKLYTAPQTEPKDTGSGMG